MRSGEVLIPCDWESETGCEWTSYDSQSLAVLIGLSAQLDYGCGCLNRLCGEAGSKSDCVSHWGYDCGSGYHSWSASRTFVA